MPHFPCLTVERGGSTHSSRSFPAETGAITRLLQRCVIGFHGLGTASDWRLSPLTRRGSASPWQHRLRIVGEHVELLLPMRHSTLRDHRAGCGRAPTVSGRDSGLMPKWSASCAPVNPAVKLCGSSAIIVASYFFHFATSRPSPP